MAIDLKGINDYNSKTSKNLEFFYPKKHYTEKDYKDGFLIVGNKLINISHKAIKDGVLTIPEGVKHIEKDAFKDCAFGKVVLPDSLERIGDETFRRQFFLEEIEFGKNVKSIGNMAFYATGIESIKIPDTVETIGSSAFCGTAFGVRPRLRKVEFGNNLKYIGSGAFAYTRLENVKFPDSLRVIDERAFLRCHELKNIEFGKNLKKIGEYAFVDICAENLEFPVSLKSIERYSFSGCRNLKNLKLNEGLESVGREAFLNCGIKKLGLPKTLQKIGEDAFENTPIESIKFTSESQLEDAEDYWGDHWLERRYGSKDKTIKEIIISGDVKRVASSEAFTFDEISKIVLEEGVEEVGRLAFSNSQIQHIELPKSLKKIWLSAFAGCNKLKQELPVNGTLVVGNTSGITSLLKVKLNNNAKIIFENVTNPLNPDVADLLNKDWNLAKKQKFMNWLLSQNKYYFEAGENFIKNAYSAFNKFENKKIKFIPSVFVMSEMPAKNFNNFFVNGNDGRWGKIVSIAGLDNKDVSGTYKSTNIPDMFSLYYALGGFSEDEAVSNKAYNFVIKELFPALRKYSADLGNTIHRHYDGLKLTGDYNPMFAGFVMKNFKGNPTFLTSNYTDYFATIHNRFKEIQEAYPHRGITGNERKSLLTPELLIEYCMRSCYTNVEPGNEKLAGLLSKYGYSQKSFDRMQKVYDVAKKCKDTYVIKANKDDAKNPVQYKFLKKDDPNGFVIGDLTNCCQRYGGAGEACVDDGYLNPNAGFLVFEELKRDENGEPIIQKDINGKPMLDDNGKPVYEAQILGQAYIWYNQNSKTVCYDNIEVPTSVLNALKKNENGSDGLKFKDLVDAVKRSANAVMDEMNADGVVRVEKVTTGEGYNDLVSQFKSFKRETEKLAKHDKQLYLNELGQVAADSYVYTDAGNAQYVLATYNKHTNNLSTSIKSSIDEGKSICANTLARVTSRTGLM